MRLQQGCRKQYKLGFFEIETQTVTLSRSHDLNITLNQEVLKEMKKHTPSHWYKICPKYKQFHIVFHWLKFMIIEKFLRMLEQLLNVMFDFAYLILILMYCFYEKNEHSSFDSEFVGNVLIKNVRPCLSTFYRLNKLQ